VTSYWSAFETLLAILKETKNNHHETPTLLLYSLVCLRKSLTAHKRYSPLSLLGTDENLGHCLGNDGWGSSNGNWGSSISTMGIGTVGKSSVGNSGVGNWGSSISSMGNWGSSVSSNWDMCDSVDWGSNSLGHGLDGVGPGLVNDWLVDSLMGTDWSGNVLGSIGGDVLEDGLGDVMGLDDRGRLEGANWGWDVGVSGLGHGVGQGRDLGDDLSESMSLGSGVGKVASEPVVLNGSRVMCGSTDKVGGGIADNNPSYRCHSNGASAGVSDERGEEQEGIHGGSC